MTGWWYPQTRNDAEFTASLSTSSGSSRSFLSSCKTTFFSASNSACWTSEFRIRFASISSAAPQRSAGNEKWNSVQSFLVDALFDPPFRCVILSISPFGYLSVPLNCMCSR